METVRTRESKQERSFDVLASVDLYRYDIETVGYIRPETRQRVYDEELSYIAEGINRPNYNSFTLKQINDELVIFHNGQWQPYLSTLMNGLKVAEAEARQDYRKSFEVKRRIDDLSRGYAMQKLQPGEKLPWHYDFPGEQLDYYGEKFLGDMGFQPERRMGYLCEAEKQPDGDVIIRHQSVDNCDEEALLAAEVIAGQGGSIDERRQAYDGALEQKHGKQFYAGRDLSDKQVEDNAWAMVAAHKDLIEEYFLKNVESLAYQQLPRYELERAKKRLTYGVWAALKERLDGTLPGMTEGSSISGAGCISVQAEVSSAYSALSARGEVLFGCGGSISGENALLNASPKSAFESIFGKKMSCPFCGTAQYGDPCASNQFCPECEAEVKNGKVISTGKGRKIKKGILDILAEELDEFNRRYDAEREEKRLKKLMREEASKAELAQQDNFQKAA